MGAEPSLASRGCPSPLPSSLQRASGEVVEDALDVFVLFERVDELEDVLRLGLVERDEVLGDVLGFGGLDGDAVGLEGGLQLAEVGERAADYRLRLALVVRALAHLFEAVVDQVQL